MQVRCALVHVQGCADNIVSAECFTNPFDVVGYPLVEFSGVNDSSHTFATMMLTLRADLYSTSKPLGHVDVKMTQVYAKIINQKRMMPSI